jgi:hypothetical protein
VGAFPGQEDPQRSNHGTAYWATANRIAAPAWIFSDFLDFFPDFLSRDRSMERRSQAEFWAYRNGKLIPMVRANRVAFGATKLGGSEAGANNEGVDDLGQVHARMKALA